MQRAGRAWSPSRARTVLFYIGEARGRYSSQYGGTKRVVGGQSSVTHAMLITITTTHGNKPISTMVGWGCFSPAFFYLLRMILVCIIRIYTYICYFTYQVHYVVCTYITYGIRIISLLLFSHELSLANRVLLLSVRCWSPRKVRKQTENSAGKHEHETNRSNEINVQTKTISH